jgi:prepilin-type N-terminal cleavage/methylation domain-containing protein
MLLKESWSNNRENGFTLLEIMVVLTLLLLVVGLVFPVSGTLHQRLCIKLSLDQLEDDLLALGAQALGGGATPVASFEPGEAYYRIEVGDVELKRQLAGLVIAMETATRIDFAARNMTNTVLAFRSSQGVDYEVSFNDRGEPVIERK